MKKNVLGNNIKGSRTSYGHNTLHFVLSTDKLNFIHQVEISVDKNVTV